jgi:hypothetical protein
MPKNNEMKATTNSTNNKELKTSSSSFASSTSPPELANNRKPTGDKKINGFDEIDSLFSEKKRRDRQEKGITKKRKTTSNVSSACIGDTLSSTRRRVNTSKPVLEGKHGTSAASATATKWVDDGLGGKFNQEGFTGRVEDGVKIFKAHVLNKPGCGQSKACPFDCDCCFI